MSKKLISLLLVLALTLTWMPATAQAWEDPECSHVLVWQGEYRSVTAYSAGDDLLFSAGDLGWMSGFKVEQDGNMILFTRGAKTVRVNTDSHVISLAGSSTGIYLQSAAKEAGGVWYLSASSVLPWLNVGCAVEDGVLYVIPNPISLWDVVDSFSLEDYAFDLDECCDKIDVDSETMRLDAYIKNNGVGILWDFVPDFNGSSLGLDKRYYNLFSDMIKDVSATDKSVEVWIELFDGLGGITGVVSTAVDLYDETVANHLGNVGKAQSGAATILEYYTYCALFQQDGADKVEVLRTLVGNSDASSSTGMVKGARQVIGDYSDFWEGIFHKASYDTVEGLTDELLSDTVLGMLGYTIGLTGGYAEAVDRIGPYLTIAGEAKNGYAKGYGGKTLDELTDYVNYALLYLYSAEQNYRAIAQYMENKRIAPMSAYYEFLDRADAAETAYAMFLNISLKLEDDCMDYSLKREKTEEYLALFQELNSDLAPHDATAAVELAIFLAALDNMGMREVLWTASDTDGDGQPELIAACQPMRLINWAYYLVLDPNDLRLEGFTSPAASITVELAVGNDGQTYYLQSDLDDDITNCSGSTLYSWSPSGWTMEASYDELWEFSPDSGDYVLASESYWVNGQGDVGVAEYQSAVDALDISKAEVNLDNPNLLDQTVPGDVEEIFDQLDAHFSWRSEDCLTISGVDLNGDGLKDRVYAIYGANNIWFDRLYMASSFENETFLPDSDVKLTLVAAETQQDGVRLRACRMDMPHISLTEMLRGSEYDAQNGTLTIGDDTFAYQSTGAPFVKAVGENAPAVKNLLGASPDKAASLLEEYHEWGEPDVGMAQGILDGEMVTLTYSEYYGAAREDSVVVEVTIMPWNLYPVAIVDGVDASMSAGKIMKNMPSCTAWTELQPLEGYDGSVFYYETTCYYRHSSGDIYEVIASFYEDDPYASLAYMTFRLAENVPQSVLDELNH